MTSFWIATLTAFVLGTVQPEPATDPVTDEVESGLSEMDEAVDCGAAELREFVGEHVSALEGLPLSERLRVYQAGDMLTTDYFPDRLNVETDAEGTILSLSCG